MTTVAEIEAGGTLSFHQALEQAEVLARQFLDPVLHERLSCAVALVRNGQVFQDANHAWLVASTTKPDHEYRINGHGCQCEDAHYRAQGRCKHQLAVFLARKSLHLMRQPPAPVVPVPPDTGAAPLDPDPERAPRVEPEPTREAEPVPGAAPGIDPRFVVQVQGKPFVKYAGLLELAHQRGLVALTAAWTLNDAELSLAHAVATFQDGRRFEESGDASPANCSGKVALHFRRVALTRAKARVLRDALGVDLVAVEELD